MNLDLQTLLPWIDLTDEEEDFHAEHVGTDGAVLSFEILHLGDGGFNLYYSEKNEDNRSDTIFSLETNEGKFIKSSLYGESLVGEGASEYIITHSSAWKELFETNTLN